MKNHDTAQYKILADALTPADKLVMVRVYVFVSWKCGIGQQHTSAFNPDNLRREVERLYGALEDAAHRNQESPAYTQLSEMCRIIAGIINELAPIGVTQEIARSEIPDLNARLVEHFAIFFNPLFEYMVRTNDPALKLGNELGKHTLNGSVAARFEYCQLPEKMRPIIELLKQIDYSSGLADSVQSKIVELMPSWAARWREYDTDESNGIPCPDLSEMLFDVIYPALGNTGRHTHNAACNVIPTGPASRELPDDRLEVTYDNLKRVVGEEHLPLDFLDGYIGIAERLETTGRVRELIKRLPQKNSASDSTNAINCSKAKKCLMKFREVSFRKNTLTTIPEELRRVAYQLSKDVRETPSPKQST